MSVSVFEQAKIQAQILVPLIKAFQTELGTERANEIARKAISDHYRRLGREWWSAKRSEDVGSNMASAFAAFSNSDALDISVREQTDDTYEIDVTRCQYAEFFQQLGEPELGFLPVCSPDFPFVEGFDADVKLTRTQTIMQKASHCDFRYKRQHD